MADKATLKNRVMGVCFSLQLCYKDRPSKTLETRDVSAAGIAKLTRSCPTKVQAARDDIRGDNIADIGGLRRYRWSKWNGTVNGVLEMHSPNSCWAS